MSAPQITLIALWAVGFGLAAAKHGQPETGKHTALAPLIGIGITAGILWWGGFWHG